MGRALALRRHPPSVCCLGQGGGKGLFSIYLLTFFILELFYVGISSYSEGWKGQSEALRAVVALGTGQSRPFPLLFELH